MVVTARPDAKQPGEAILDRHYRAPKAALWYMRCFLAASALLVIPVSLDNRSGAPALAITVPYVTVLGVLFVWAERRFPKAGMFETDEGLRVVRLIGSADLRWDLIAGFEASQRPPRSRVLVVAKSGRRVPIVGTAQGARIAWDGGDTRDIVGVLNERLATWRAQRTDAREVS